MHREKNGTVALLFEWVVAFVLAFAFFLAVRTFVISPYTVPSASMEPTIMVGDNVFAEKLSVRFGDGVHPGDIAIFHNPDGSSAHDILVKRVIASAGQTVDLIEGRVFVDGVQLDEEYTIGASVPLPTQAPGVQVSFPYTVPAGAYWVMGDNRENSADSRYFGPVSASFMIGRVVFRYWPLDRIGSV